MHFQYAHHPGKKTLGEILHTFWAGVDKCRSARNDAIFHRQNSFEKPRNASRRLRVANVAFDLVRRRQIACSCLEANNAFDIIRRQGDLRNQSGGVCPLNAMLRIPSPRPPLRWDHLPAFRFRDTRAVHQPSVPRLAIFGRGRWKIPQGKLWHLGR